MTDGSRPLAWAPVGSVLGASVPSTGAGKKKWKLPKGFVNTWGMGSGISHTLDGPTPSEHSSPLSLSLPLPLPLLLPLPLSSSSLSLSACAELGSAQAATNPALATPAELKKVRRDIRAESFLSRAICSFIRLPFNV